MSILNKSFLKMIGEPKLTAIEKMNLAKKGISKNALEELKNLADLDYDKLAKALAVTRSTLITKKKTEKFNTSVSERIVSLADIYTYGYEVFESIEKFNEWMFHPNKALGGKYPFEFTDTQFGREEIRNIIGRIAYGVYS
jgi:putative toxin-antitoxin system antitoxin component (TIGR02293 family)